MQFRQPPTFDNCILSIVPPNTTAEIRIPAQTLTDVTESGRRLELGQGVQLLGMKNGRASYRAVSGSYVFALRVGTGEP